MAQEVQQNQMPAMGAATTPEVAPKAPKRPGDPRLPKEEVPASSAKRVALIILVPIALIAALNWIAGAWLKDNTPNTGYLRIHKKFQMLEALSQPVDTLIIGDSSGAQGIDPEVVQQELGGSAINLCTVADMAVVTPAVMLDQYLKKHPAPKRVILIHVYDIWSRPMTGYAMAQMPYSPTQAGEIMPWYPLTTGQRNEWYTGKYFPLYAESGSLTKAIGQRLKGKVDSVNKRRGIRDDGFSRTDNPDPKQIEADIPQHLAATRDATFHMNDGNLLALQHMIEVAQKNGFELYLVNSPLLEDIYRENSFRRYYNQVVGELFNEVIGQPRMHYLFQRPQTYSRDQMTNADHLIYSGAEDFTQRLCGAIQAEEARR